MNLKKGWIFQWKDLVSWYNKTGHKYFGSIVDNVRIAIRFVAEIAKDIFHYVASEFFKKIILQKKSLIGEKSIFVQQLEIEFVAK